MTSKWEKTVRTKRRRLHLRHEKLIDFYFGEANFNKSKALRLCGYACAHKYTRLFDHPAISEEIERRYAELRKRHEVTFERVRDEIARVAYTNIYDYATPAKDSKGRFTGDLIFDFAQLDAATAAAIGEVVVETYTEGKGDDAREVKRIRVKPWNKLVALEQLMRHAGLSKDKTGAALADVAGRLAAGLKRIGGKQKEESDE